MALSACSTQNFERLGLLGLLLGLPRAGGALAQGLEATKAGVVARRALGAGEVLLEVDARAAISEPAAPGALAAMAVRLLRGDGGAGLAELRQPDALHRWPAAALDELRWPPLAAAAARDSELLEALHAEHGCAAGGADLGRFADAFDVCRAYALPHGGALHLLPGIDAFGWSARRGAMLERSGAALRVTCSEALAADALVTLSGGWRTNEELLVEQGFACVGLPSDAVSFTRAHALDAAAAVGVLDARTAALREDVLGELHRMRYLTADGDGDELSVLSGGFASDQLGILLQAACISPAELEALGAAASSRPALGAAVSIGEGVVLSIGHERRVGAALRALCERGIGVSTADLAADEARLAAIEAGAPRPPGVGPPLGDLSNRLAEALRARVGRARVLAECAARAAGWAERPTVMASLRRPWKANVRTSG